MHTHLSRDDRITIHALRRRGIPLGEIAEDIGKSRSTIYRELARCPGRYYDPHAAHARAKMKRRRASCAPRKMTRSAWRHCCKMLRRHKSAWSAAQTESFPVCATTFYKWLWRAGCAGSHMKPRRPRKTMMLHAPHKWMSFGPGHYRKRPKDKRFAMMRDAAPIALRPAIVERRGRFGDWEADTMHWGSTMSLTLRERKSGVVLLAVLPERSAAAAAKLIIRMLRGLPAKTITSDGGWEFRHWRLVEKALGAKWYVCDPGRPQQRGGVEHANGIVRRMARADVAECGLRTALRRAQKIINHRPTKRLQSRTPAEVLGL